MTRGVWGFIALAAAVVLPPVSAQTVKSLSVANGADWSGGVTRGGVIAIFVENIGPGTEAASALPLPTMLRGVRVLVQKASAAEPATISAAPLLYVSPNQINAILPSTVSGSLRLSVESNGIEVARGDAFAQENRFATFTVQSQGFGPGVILNVDAQGGLALNQFLRPARPGQAVAMWGTGLGALISGADAEPPPAMDLSDGVTVWVGGVAVKPLYAGRAPGLPGVDQINFIVPEGLQQGCYVPVAVETKWSLGKEVTMAVASGDICVSEFGLSREALSRLDAGGSVTGAILILNSVATATKVQQRARAWLGRYDAAYLSLLVHSRAADHRCKFRQAHSMTLPADPADAYQLGSILGVTQINTEIRGADGCVWAPASRQQQVYHLIGSETCPAATFSFSGSAPGPLTFSVAGTIPAPRSTDAIASFTWDRHHQASWTINTLAPGDAVLLLAHSHHKDPPAFYTTCENSCEVSPSLSSLSLGICESSPTIASATMTLSTTSDQSPTSASMPPDMSPDFILVRTENGAQAGPVSGGY